VGCTLGMAMFKNKHASTKLDEMIISFPGAVSLSTCDELVSAYKDAEWNQSYFHSEAQGVRTCNEIRMPASPLDTEIFNIVGKCLSAYHEKFVTTASTDEGYTLLRYREGQSIGPHMDDTTGLGRVLSCSILLNDEFTGGHFSFWNGEAVIAPKKGTVLMFPANFMYPHQITPVSTGTRYSIITWLR
jgi:predicted 2-oxoglutarate/Fe(II)-dependent dioxygenase YbiX